MEERVTVYIVRLSLWYHSLKYIPHIMFPILRGAYEIYHVIVFSCYISNHMEYNIPYMLNFKFQKIQFASLKKILDACFCLYV